MGDLTNSAALDGVIDAAFSEQCRLLETLVEHPSHTHAANDVEQSFAPFDAAVRKLGFAIERVPDPEGRFADHRVCRLQAKGSPSLALVGHMDTVFPRSLGFLHCEISGDRVHGPGALDMKSGLTSMVFALRAIRAVAPERFAELPISLIVVSDEEVGSPSSARQVYANIRSEVRAALVFEAGREADRIATARRGSAVFRIEAVGRAAHAGLKHQEGINAIHALCLLVPAVEALTDYDKPLTCNVGLMEGGTARNTVPESASCVIDVRFERASDGEAVERALRELCTRGVTSTTVPRIAQARFTLSGGITRPPMEPTPATQDLRRLYERHALSVGLQVGEAPVQGGGSDANLLAAHGIPVIDGLGPAGEHYHRTEEWCSLDSLRRRTKALARLLSDDDLYARFLPA